jgi:replicative DNA helicase
MQNSSSEKKYTNQSPAIVQEPLTKLMPIYAIYESVRKSLQERTGVIRYPTGLSELDEKLWGMHKGELLTVGARTSQGKSVFALQIAKNLAIHGQTVLFFSLEMSKEQLVERLLSNMCEIDNNQLRKGSAWHEVEKKDEPFRSWLDNARLVIDDQSGYHFKSIVEVIKEIKPDFVIVDYVQMISTKGFKDKLSALEDFVKEMHRMGKLMNFGNILISQINRSGAEDRPFMHQLKAAGVLEEHSDIVILLQWKFEDNAYFAYVEKNRHGEVGAIKLNFEPQYFRMSDYKGERNGTNTHQAHNLPYTD